MNTSRSPSSSTLKSIPLLVLFLLLLSTSLPTTTEAYSYSQLKTLMSLSHSLMNRVANLRAQRGDYTGSFRARRIAEKLNGGGLGFWKGISLMGWDYLKNYAWRDMSTVEMFRVVSDMKEILKGMNELTRLKSDKERMAWMVRNYQNIFRISKSMLQKLLHVFSRSGPVRELVLILQEEVEGGLLRDCLELGTSDLKGVIQIVKDIALQFAASHEHDDL